MCPNANMISNGWIQKRGKTNYKKIFHPAGNAEGNSIPPPANQIKVPLPHTDFNLTQANPK